MEAPLLASVVINKNSSVLTSHGVFFFFSSRRRHTRSLCDWSSDVCSSDLLAKRALNPSLCFLPQRPNAPESLFPFPRQKNQAHASIFAFLKAHQVLFDEQPQIGRASCRERV